MTKRLIATRPEDFVKWLASDATYIGRKEIELKSLHIYADALLWIEKPAGQALLEIEVQTYDDPDILIRLMEYGMLASRENNHLPVYSYVICLRKEADVANSPLILRNLEGKPRHIFYYEIIRLWEIPAEAILQTEWPGILPFTTLAKGGKQSKIVKAMIAYLAQREEWDLLAISRLIGGLVFKKESERKSFRKGFDMFHDILRETEVYKEIVQEMGDELFKQGIEQGIERGIEQGRERERKEFLKLQRQTLTDLVELHFPELIPLAKEQSEKITEPKTLQALILKLMRLQDASEARKVLFEADKH